MNIHTVTEVPDDFKPIFANAEAFGEAIRGPLRRGVVQDWVEREKRPTIGLTGRLSSNIQKTHGNDPNPAIQDIPYRKITLP